MPPVILPPNSIGSVPDVFAVPQPYQRSLRPPSLSYYLDWLVDEIEAVEYDGDDRNETKLFEDEDDDGEFDFISEGTRQEYIRTEILASIEYSNYRKVLVAKIFNRINSMGYGEMEDALSTDSHLKPQLLVCLHYVLRFTFANDETQSARQYIVDFAKSQSSGLNAELFGTGPVNFSGLDLSGLRFVGVDLNRANFEGANLTRVIFDGVNLHHAKFNETNLTGAYINNSNLWCVEFVRSNLRNLTFKSGNLGGVKFTESVLKGAIFVGESGTRVDFGRTDLSQIDMNGPIPMEIRTTKLPIGRGSGSIHGGPNSESRERGTLQYTQSRNVDHSDSNVEAEVNDVSVSIQVRRTGVLPPATGYSQNNISRGVVLGQTVQSNSTRSGSFQTKCADEGTSASLPVATPPRSSRSNVSAPTRNVALRLVWGWISGLTARIGSYFRSVYLRLWR